MIGYFKSLWWKVAGLFRKRKVQAPGVLAPKAAGKLEQINSTTWRYRLPSGDYAYIGNPDSNKLEAHLKGTRFDGESGFGLGFPLIGDLTNITPKIIGDTFELSKGDYKAKFYPDLSSGDKGGFEFELVLGKKPPVNFL